MPENQIVEWKSSWRDEWLKWICGYANAQGGTLVVGMDDEGNVVGVDGVKRLSEDIPNKIRYTLGIVPEVNLLEADGLDYIEIVVEPYDMAISYHGKYYYRTGSIKSELTGAELNAFLLKKTGQTWDAVAVPGLTVADLKTDALKLFRKKALESGRLSEAELDVSNEVLLRNLRLFNGSQLMMAAALLFHEDPELWAHSAYVKIGYFEKSDSDLVYQDEVHGPLIEQVDRVIDLLYTKYMKAYIWYDGIQRIETFMFPQDACRELVLNAIQHKNYSQAVTIQISVYPDKIYIYNIGEMPAVITPAEKLYEKHPSVARNPNIAGAFFRSGMVESWGRGYDKVIAACERVGAVLPAVEANFGGLMVRIDESPKYQELRLERSDLSQPRETEGETDNETEDDLAAAILALLTTDGSITQLDLTRKTGRHRSSITRTLKQLKDDGLIERVGSDRAGYWRVLQ